MSAPRRDTLALVATCTGFFLAMIDTTAVNVALPAIGAGLHARLPDLQWIVDGYNIAFAGLLLTGGALGDRYGRRRLFHIGIGVFVAGSLVCALAGSVGVVVAGRVVQGVGAGILLPQSLSILAAITSDPAARNRAMAAWSIVGGAGLAAGPGLGGAVVDLFGWQVLFALNLPLGALAMLLAARHVPETRSTVPRPLHLAAQTRGVLALGATTFAVVDGGRLGWDSPVVLTAGALAVVALLGFLHHERRDPDPLIPSALRRGTVPVACAVAGCMTFGMFGMFMLVPLAFVAVRDTDVLTAGLQMMPLPLVFMALSPAVGRYATRHGHRRPMVLGTLAMATGIGLLAVAGIGSHLAVVQVAFVIAGAGLALNTGPVMALAVAGVDPDRVGVASGLANTARMLGASLGVAVQGAVLSGVTGGALQSGDFERGVSAALAVGAAAELLGCAIAVLCLRPASDTHAAPAPTSDIGGTVDDHH